MEQEILDRMKSLEEKYSGMGQNMESYLDGLLMSNVTSYWDYTNLDILLKLQQPKTDFPDELVFIIYHQVNELFFRLSLHELEQIAHNGRNVLLTGEDLGWKDELEPGYFIERVGRVNRYFEALTKSFEIMINGMEKEQFLKFRMALLPASGFQSAQYRKVEICSTDFIRIVDKDHRAQFEGKEVNDELIEEMFEYSYWKQGAVELESGKKTLTLEKFEKKYSKELIKLAKQQRTMNLWAKYKAMPEEAQNNEDLKNVLRQLDVNVNINWPLVHYKSAARYLERGDDDVTATGGTNWQQYLPPRFQKRIFYPELWTQQEMEEWGKTWVESVIKENAKEE